MPRTLPAGTQTWLAAQGGNRTSTPIVLADIQTADGTQYFWSDVEGTFTSKLNGTPQFYNGWIKNGFSFTRTRDLSTDAGDVVVQNLSGNSISRDVASALSAREFVGGIMVLRLWLPLLDVVLDEFHCQLTEPTITEEDASFRAAQLFDTTQYNTLSMNVQESCGLLFKGVQCGSTGAAGGCDKLFTTCKDVNHAAQERFNGVLYIIPGLISAPTRGTGGGVDPGDSGRDIGPHIRPMLN